MQRFLLLTVLHLTLYALVVAYIYLGALVYNMVEAEAELMQKATETRKVEEFRRVEIPALMNRLTLASSRQEIESLLSSFAQKLEEEEISFPAAIVKPNFSQQNGTKEEKEKPPLKWAFSSSFLFAFTILTTIGYGNIAPATFTGQLFTIVYALVGIPLFLIALTDLGHFVRGVIRFLLTCLFGFKKVPTSSEENLEKGDELDEKMVGEELSTGRKIVEFGIVLTLFVFFILLGAAILPLWEKDMEFFKAVYYCFISISTIGLGDIVPQDMKFLPLTLLYITIGLWLTTDVLEQITEIFRMVHFAGRRLTDLSDVSVWIGGRRMRMEGVISAVGKVLGQDERQMSRVNWASLMNDAAEGKILPALLAPVLPIHSASSPVTPRPYRPQNLLPPRPGEDEFASNDGYSLLRNASEEYCAF